MSYEKEVAQIGGIRQIKIGEEGGGGGGVGPPEPVIKSKFGGYINRLIHKVIPCRT